MRLSTVGRRTGLERSVMVGYFEDGPNLVTMAMNGWGEGEPARWLNLQAQPNARVDVADGPRLVTDRAAPPCSPHCSQNGRRTPARPVRQPTRNCDWRSSAQILVLQPLSRWVGERHTCVAGRHDRARSECGSQAMAR